MTGTFDDLRLALRRLRHQPGFSAVAILTLALGLGANTAIYTLVHAVMLQPLPVDRPEDLYRLGDEPNCCVNSGFQTNYSLYSTRFVQEARQQLGEFATLTAFQANAPATSLRAPGSAAAASVPAEFVSANYFTTLGTHAAAGRLLQADDDRRGAPLAFVISHRTWTEVFDADRSVIGKTMPVGGTPMTLVGVTVEGFFGDTARPDPSGLWLPLGQEEVIRGDASLASHFDQDWLYVIGRLAPGSSASAASAHATSLLQQFLTAEVPLPAGVRDQIPRQRINVVLAPGGVNVLGQTFGQPLMVLFAMSGVVLLIAAANLANLLLARVNAGEAALRTALGASSVRLIRQPLVEGIVLSLAGGAAALVVASLATRSMVALAFPGVAYVPLATGPSTGTLLFAFALALVTGVLFSVAPAWAGARAHPIDALRGIGRSGQERAFVPRRSLVIVQVALSLMLLTGAGLLGRSLSQLETQPLGFEVDRRMVVFINALPGSPTIDQLATLFDGIVDRVGRIPGVEHVSYSLYSPMEGNNWSGGISIEGRPRASTNQDNASWNRVGPDYFDTIGTEIVQGRGITSRDSRTSERVAVVNETFVRQYLPDVNPLTRHVGLAGPSHANDFAIVGVAEDVKYTGASRPVRPMIFLPGLQTVTYSPATDGNMPNVQTRSLMMRAIEIRLSPAAPSSPEPAIRRALAEVDPNITVLRLRSMADQVSVNFRLNRLMSRLTTAYGLLALALATLGLYGVTAYGVSRRRREIGVRLALGANPGRVVREVLRGALVSTAIGLLAGIPVALASANAVASMLYNVQARDPLMLAAAGGALLMSALVAAFVPARRAAAMNPTEALRAE